MNTSDLEQELERLAWQTNLIHITIGAFFSPIGVVLNLFSAFVFLTNRKLNHKTNMGLLYGAVALADAVTLLMMGMIFENLLPYFGALLLVESDSLCKIGRFIWRLTVHMSSWLQVMVAFERFLYVNYPIKSAHLRQKRVLLLMILALFCSLFLLNSINFSYFVLQIEELDVNNQSTIFVSECTSTRLVTIIADNLYSLLRSIVPFALMAYFNFKTVRRVLSSRVQTNSSGGSVSQRRLNKETMFTRSMLAFNSLFVISFFASFLFYAYKNIRDIIVDAERSAIEIARDEFLLMIALAFSQIYQALTFFINLVFNKAFRAELYQMIYSRTLFPKSELGQTTIIY
nr:G protein-coupled receptor [Proales similis]